MLCFFPYSPTISIFHPCPLPLIWIIAGHLFTTHWLNNNTVLSCYASFFKRSWHMLRGWSKRGSVLCSCFLQLNYCSDCMFYSGSQKILYLLRKNPEGLPAGACSGLDPVSLFFPINNSIIPYNFFSQFPLIVEISLVPPN